MSLNTRGLAADLLVDVIEGGQSLTARLESTLALIPNANDRAFVQALGYGVLRGYFRLTKILALLTRKPIKDARVRTLALLGLFQLRDMRVKPHAAVGETVAAASPWARPLLNGILRSYQREQARLEELAATDLAAATAHPAWLVEWLQRDWPETCADLLQHNNEPAPLTLRVNRLRIARDDYLEQLTRQGIPARAAGYCSSALTLEQPLPVDAIPGFDQGLVSVQDGAAQLAAGLMNLRAGQRVLDVCAAPGGKTVHMLETCPDLAELVAVDIAPERLQRIRDNLHRCGLDARLIAADAARPEAWWDGRPFDRILVDAPCSATGVIRRHPDIKILRQAADIDELARQQQRILAAAWQMLAADGELVYATCSVLRQENEQTIARFLRDHPAAREQPITADWGVAVHHGRQILTASEGMDGFYYARLSKTPDTPCR